MMLTIGITFIIEYNSQAGSSSKSRSTRKTKHEIFAPASPAMSRRIQASTGPRKPSLRATDTGMIFIILIYISF